MVVDCIVAVAISMCGVQQGGGCGKKGSEGWEIPLPAWLVVSFVVAINQQEGESADTDGPFKCPFGTENLRHPPMSHIERDLVLPGLLGFCFACEGRSCLFCPLTNQSVNAKMGRWIRAAEFLLPRRRVGVDSDKSGHSRIIDSPTRRP